ncbi:MAG TPA: ROK family protein [Sedimentisphaerales bacterium]|nr:ROK family protein [Sedimentisphaerales bacterium]
MSGDVYVGIDLGGTNIRVGLFGRGLGLLEKVVLPTNSHSGPQRVVDRIAEATRNVVSAGKLDMCNVRAAGVGAPGPIDIAEGVICFAPNMPGFENVPLKKMLADRLKVPVVVENDANAACWGEFVAGAGRGTCDMALITLGTGVGGGLISNGRLVHGFRDGAAEFGHTIIYPDGRLCACGQKGCVEAYASATSTAARAAEGIRQGRASGLAGVLNNSGVLTSRDVYEQLAAGDELAREITDGTAKALAVLCVNLVRIASPELIAFGGGMMAAGDILLNRVRQMFEQLIWSSQRACVRLIPALLGEDAGIVGAAALASQAS